jgi:DNA polymerase-3 subunit gamma/tau
MWPDLLRQVQGMKRATWLIISANAQVHDLTNGVLRLSFSNQGTAIGFGKGQHAEVVAAAVEQLLGVTVRVEAVPGGPGAGAPAAGATTSAAASAPASSTTRAVPSWGEGAGAPSAPAPAGPPDWFEQPPPPDDEPPPTPRPAAGAVAPHPAPAGQAPKPRMSRVEQMARASAPARDAELDTPSEDDPDLEDAGPAGTSVVEQLLGGQVIDVEHERG